MANEGKNALKQEVARIKENIRLAYVQCDEKGAEMPSVQNSDNLPSTIASITQGGDTIITQIVGDFAKYNIQIEHVADDVYALVVNDYVGTTTKHNYYMGDITGDVTEGVTSLYITDI